MRRVVFLRDGLPLYGSVANTPLSKQGAAYGGKHLLAGPNARPRTRKASDLARQVVAATQNARITDLQPARLCGEEGPLEVSGWRFFLPGVRVS